jgi:hypothetical protein
MRGGAVACGRPHGRPPDGASCSRRAGLQQCKSFVEMCIVSCLSAVSACICGLVLQPGTALVVVCLAVVTLPTRSTSPTVAGCRLVGCSVVSGLPLRCGRGVTARLCLPGARSGLPCPVPACCCRCRLARAGLGSHCGVELWLSRIGKGSSGGRKKGGV